MGVPFHSFSAGSGYRIAFRPEGMNVCPCCHKSNWLLGRMTAECAFCGTALPIEGGGMTGAGLFRRRESLPADRVPEAA